MFKTFFSSAMLVALSSTLTLTDQDHSLATIPMLAAQTDSSIETTVQVEGLLKVVHSLVWSSSKSREKNHRRYSNEVDWLKRIKNFYSTKLVELTRDDLMNLLIDFDGRDSLSFTIEPLLREEPKELLNEIPSD